MKEKNAKWEAFLTLINEKIKETNARYAGTEKLEFFAWGYRYYDDDTAVFGSNHYEAFFHADFVMKMALAFGLDTYLCIKPNADNNPTPCVAVYY